MRPPGTKCSRRSTRPSPKYGLGHLPAIIEAHKGWLWASANEPQGAVFQFALLAEREETAPVEPLCLHNLPVAGSLTTGRSFPCQIALHFERRFRKNAANKRNLLAFPCDAVADDICQSIAISSRIKNTACPQTRALVKKRKQNAKISAPEILRVGRAGYC